MGKESKNKKPPEGAEFTSDKSRRYERLDTSVLYSEMCREYATRRTPVDVDFRQFVYWLRAGDQLSHHIHPYPGKLLPHIAHFFVRTSMFGNRNGVVLDPFCGSGTVALEASLAGRTPYVADANPLALLVSDVKTTPYDTAALRQTGRIVVESARRYRKAPVIEIVNEKLWYSPEQKKSLEILLRSVLRVECPHERDFFKVCFSVAARRLSFADPAISVPVRLRTKPHFSPAANRRIRDRLRWIRKASPVAEFQKIVEANINRVDEANAIFPKRERAVNVGNDARDLLQPGNARDALADNSIPLVITSPPYGSAQKYVRASSLSLNWLGMASPADLAILEAKSIGREHLPKHQQPLNEDVHLPRKFEALLKIIQSRNELRARITKRYLIEMQCVVHEISRILSINGRVVFVIGNNQVCGEVLRNDEFLIRCFEKTGMELELSMIDNIKSRGLMTKRNKTASVISRETVLVFRRG